MSCGCDPNQHVKTTHLIVQLANVIELSRERERELHAAMTPAHDIHTHAHLQQLRPCSVLVLHPCLAAISSKPVRLDPAHPEQHVDIKTLQPSCIIDLGSRMNTLLTCLSTLLFQRLPCRQACSQDSSFGLNRLYTVSMMPACSSMACSAPGLSTTWFPLPLCSQACPKKSHSWPDCLWTMRTVSTSQSGCAPLAL